MTNVQAIDDAKYRFNWDDLPTLTPDLTGTGGDIRSEIDDFVVIEIPAYEASGEGVHAYAFVEKRELTTLEVVKALAGLGVHERDVGFAGMKDKYAVTRQWFSVPEAHADAFKALDDIEGISVLEVSRHNNNLGIGHLRANRFEIRVRNADDDATSGAEAIIERLRSDGLPNYFGPQRFGRFNGNIADGLRVARGERVPGGRRMHKLFLSSLQSHVFNWLLKARLERGLFGTVVSGDLAQKHDTGGKFIVSDLEAESLRAARFEISSTLPIFGKKVGISDGKAGEIESETLEWFDLTVRDFRSTMGDRRISRLMLDDLEVEGFDNGFVLSFTLSKGSYATSLLREVLKTNVDVTVPRP